MLHTSEARWFFKGELPDRVVAWFGSDPSKEAEARSDCYLVFPGCDSVGVKLRDANDPSQSHFEVKARMRGPHVARLGPRVTARVDEWVKWSAPLDRFSQWADSILTSEPTWITVDKQRSQRLFSVDGAEPTEVALEDEPKEGCTVDLVTLLAAGNEPWWTVGLESFGSAESCAPNLLQVGRFVFSESVPQEFEIVQSLSYATWAAAQAPD
jgi:hypothetical protein